MTTSPQHAPSAPGFPAPPCRGISRHDSGGTSFLPDSNVVVRGPSPSLGVGAQAKPESQDGCGGPSKVSQDATVDVELDGPSKRSSEGPTRRISNLSALSKDEGAEMDVDEDDLCSLDAQVCVALEADSYSPFAPQVATDAVPPHYEATPLQSAFHQYQLSAAAAYISTEAHPSDRAYRAMQRILLLNQLALDRYNAGTVDASVSDALHEAEWTRCYLANALASVRSGPALSSSANVPSNRAAKMALYLSQSGMSSSFTDRTSSTEQRAAKCVRRTGSLDCTASQQFQEKEDISRTSYRYQYQRMDFDEGMHSFPGLESIDPASLWDAPSNSVSPAIEATLLFNVGQVHRRRGELDAASKCYDHALDALAGWNAVSVESHLENMLSRHPVVIPVLHNIGSLQYRRGDIGPALETYNRALRLSRAMYGDRHPHVAAALNCLGVLHYHDANSPSDDAADTTGETSSDTETGGSTARAMELFQQSLASRIEVLGPNHVEVATVLNNIGRIHVQHDEFDLALGYYENALRIRRTILGSDNLDYAATAFNAGQSFHQKGELGRASELYNEFLRVALMKFGHAHRDVAVVLSGIAQIHQERGENAKALELYEASLCAGKAALGEHHSEIAMLLNRMGNFYFEQERLDDALRCYKRGLRIERRVLPPDHPNIVVTLSNLGEIHRQKGEWDEAAAMYSDCLAILKEKHAGKDHVDVASTLSTIGLIHDQRGDACKSLRHLQDALLMRRRLLGSDHLDVASTLVYIGTILYRKGVLSMALELFTESLRIRRTSLGPDHRDCAFVLYNIALCYQQRGCHEEAIEAYAETLRIEKLVLGDGHRDVSMTLFKLGEVYRAASDLEKAMECFRKSLAIERSVSSGSDAEEMSDEAQAEQQRSGPDPAAQARALNEIGNIHLARGESGPMMEAFNEASRLYEEAGLSPNNVVVSGRVYAWEDSFPEHAPAA
ncbi:hypothetical protein ACHAXT_007526 [Thalassiosira profunda]